MEFCGKTDIGKKRSTNQDNFYVGYISRLPDEKKVLLAVVCDGMGGAAGGNVASSLAVSVFTSFVEKKVRESLEKGICLFESILTDAVDQANTAVYEQATNDPALSGMGTTLVSCIITDDSNP